MIRASVAYMYANTDTSNANFFPEAEAKTKAEAKADAKFVAIYSRTNKLPQRQTTNI
jgi:hypothetical protein